MPADFHMARNVYLVTMRPLTSELMTWDESRQSSGFAEQWKVEDVQIIVVDGKTVGWVQAAEMDSEIFLQQFFIEPEFQGRGIGSQVLESLLALWKKPVILTVLRNNPAHQRLYERHGFTVVGEAGVKIKMRRMF